MMDAHQSELIREDYGDFNVIFVHAKIDDLGLSVYAFRVYAHLARRASNPRGCAWPSIAQIAKVCRIGETKVREALSELDERRMIVREARAQQSYLVRITPQSQWRELPEGVVRHANPSCGEPLATRTPRRTNQGGSPHEPKVYPLKEREREELPGLGEAGDREAAERTARANNERELKRTMPPSLVTGDFVNAWEAWVVYWSASFNHCRPIPFATIDLQLEFCRTVGEKRAIAAIKHTMEAGLRRLCEPTSQNANHRTGNNRRFEQSGEYGGVINKLD